MASIHESNRYLTEKFAETDRIHKENERFLTEKFAETDRQIKESDEKREKEWAKYEKRMKRMEEEMGAWGNNHGAFAEEYFYNSFDEGQQFFFGERFDEIEKNLKPKSITINGIKLKDEYDIVLFNHSAVAIIEVKFKAHENDVAKVLNKVETFRILCPDYKDYRIYLGLASMSFYPELEKKCSETGIAIIKQVGDSVVIYDDHLKVF
jgi:hypothetical protein